MVRIRLSRTGAKKRPFYHIVVADGEKSRDGRFIERLGYYDPSRPVVAAHVDHMRFDFWVQRGAQSSERVEKLVRAHRRSTAATTTSPAAQS